MHASLDEILCQSLYYTYINVRENRAGDLAFENQILSCRQTVIVSAMATGASNLRENEFYARKLRQFVRVTDTDKDGYISRHDFDLVVERYKQLGVCSPQHLEKISASMASILDLMGITDPSVKMTYEQYEDKWFGVVMNLQDNGLLEKLFMSMFDSTDLNEDGYLSIDEWTAQGGCWGIDKETLQTSFNNCDVNGDGKVSKEEFTNYFYEFIATSENKLNSSIHYGVFQ